MLEINNASKTFLKGTVNEHIALSNVNLKLEDGEFITIVGSNGAGKSTLFNAICGSYLLDSGSVWLDNTNITFMAEHRRARNIGRLYQDTMKGTAPHLTIEENLALAYTRSKHNPFKKAITGKERRIYQNALEEFKMGLEDRLETKVGLLSGGQRQVVTLLMATIVPPRLLLLDEHTAALDPATAEKVMKITNDIVSRNHLTTLMITHNLKSALTTGNRTIMMDSGSIIFDIPETERKNLTMEALLKMYSKKKNQEFDNDRILLS